MFRSWKKTLAPASGALLALGYGACGGGDQDASPSDPSSELEASAPPTDASASCGDIATDVKNCGRCGHDCLGGACNAGTCAPVVIGKGQFEVDGMAIGPDGAYFTSYSQGTLARCAFPCAGPATELYKGKRALFGVAVDEKYAFFSDWDDRRGVVRKCALPDCRGGPIDVVLGIDQPARLAVVRSRLLWTGAFGQVGVAMRDRVDSAAKYLVPPQEGLGSIGASSDRVYWLVSVDGLGELRTCALPDCPDGPRVIARGLEGPRGIVVSSDARALVWGDHLATSLSWRRREMPKREEWRNGARSS